MAQDELELAIRHLQRAVELKPDYLKAHQSLASALEKAGRLAEAKQHLDTVKRLSESLR